MSAPEITPATLHARIETLRERIADLDRLWLQLEAFEQDLAWLRYGQAVTIEVEALPGELFEGRVTFLGDVVDARTRTTEVRVHRASGLCLTMREQGYVLGVARIFLVGGELRSNTTHSVCRE